MSIFEYLRSDAWTMAPRSRSRIYAFIRIIMFTMVLVGLGALVIRLLAAGTQVVLDGIDFSYVIAGILTLGLIKYGAYKAGMRAMVLKNIRASIRGQRSIMKS